MKQARVSLSEKRENKCNSRTPYSGVTNGIGAKDMYTTIEQPTQLMTSDLHLSRIALFSFGRYVCDFRNDRRTTLRN